MLPISDTNINGGIVVEKQPSLSYMLKLEKERIERNIDGVEAVKQAVYKMLMTDRYKYKIYDRNYGVELDDLIGKPKSFVESEFARRVEDALLTDDRIKTVTDFVFTEVDKTTFAVSFVVATIFGDMPVETEVSINV